MVVASISTCCLALFVLSILKWTEPSEVSPTPAIEAYGLTDYGTVIYSVPTRISKMVLRHALTRCETVPELADSPRFQYLQQLPGDTVELAPEDILMLYLYDGSSETVEFTRKECAGKEIEIFLMEHLNGDGGYTFSGGEISGWPPSEEEVAAAYAEWVEINRENDNGLQRR